MLLLDQADYVCLEGWRQGMKRLREDIGGEMKVSLAIAGGRVFAVKITSGGAGAGARMFIGREPAEILPLIGSVYSLCGTAQSIAALMAVETAAGLQVSSVQQAARDVLRLSEMLSQTAIRLFLSWPKLIDLQARPDIVRHCLELEQALEDFVMGGRNWKVAGGVNLAPDKLAAARALGHIDAALKKLRKLDGFADSLRTLLRDRDLERFGVLPTGVDVEEGALCRHWDRSEVVSARGAYGAGLAARLAASFCDLFDLPKKINELVNLLVVDTPPDHPNVGDGQGTARVETARGWLRHQVSLKNGQITDYQINAPTEVNFRTGGPVVAGLVGADAANHQALLDATYLHIMAIDPCVGFQVEVIHA